MQTEQSSRQQIIDRIKKANSILVTVNHDPSVDALSSALGLTLMLNKIGKHATAVFSGQTPPAIDFLEPGKTFEQNVDSLRDFIIALDKEKADRLRYKVEDDFVRIYITPYRTNISEKDLQFSQGDFNVDLIVALGVDKKDDLDQAISAHGRILHDAGVVTINATQGTSSLGEVEWNNEKASGLAEMMMSLSEALQPNLLDEQIATAMLTGLVSVTDRFRNAKTSPKVMTMAAQLMAAGANQQLIAEKLETTLEVAKNNEGIASLGEGEALKVNQTPDLPIPTPSMESVSPGDIEVAHDTENTQLEPIMPSAQFSDEQKSADALEVAQDELAQALPPITTPDTSTVDDLREQVEAAVAVPVPESIPTSPVPETDEGKTDWRKAAEPTFGGTLNATANEAEDANRREEESDKNRVILSHDANAADESPAIVEQTSVPPIETNTHTYLGEAPSSEVVPDGDAFLPSTAPSGLSFEPTGIPVADSSVPSLVSPSGVDDARAAVDAAINNATLGDLAIAPVVASPDAPGRVIEPLVPAPVPSSVSSEPVPSSVPNADPGVILPPPPPLPPLPDFSTLPQFPNPVATPSEVPTPYPSTPTPSVSADPAQFRIPGQ